LKEWMEADFRRYGDLRAWCFRFDFSSSENNRRWNAPDLWRWLESAGRSVSLFAFWPPARVVGKKRLCRPHALRDRRSGAAGLAPSGFLEIASPTGVLSPESRLAQLSKVIPRLDTGHGPLGASIPRL
jgi:hypothetical protein